tara:strand:- start:58 stop:648 length:591 start_codon:yes stop_codon:yes gene_type:complete
MKECTKCKESKELSEFGKDKRKTGGLKGKCKSCIAICDRNRDRTKEGKLKRIYHQQVGSSIKRGHEPPLYTQKEFVNRYLNDLDYERHYYSWVISNYSKDYSPSFDRLDDYKGYSFDNIQIMYWFENSTKYRLDTKEGRNNKTSKAVVGINIKTGKQIEFYSAHEASRNGFNQGAISNCCGGRQKTHKGYTWKYKN